LAQLFLDASRFDDFSGILGNFTKLGLSALSLSFDILFILQHYALYPEREKPEDDETEPLLTDT
jgi:cystinosin